MNLADWMIKSNTSAAELARRCGVHLVTVYKWKAGTIFPRPSQLQALAEATGGAVTANDFAGVGPSAKGSRRRDAPPGLAEAQAPFAAEAQALGLDAAAIAARAVQEAIRAEKARRWLEENQDAIEAWNRWTESNELPLAEYRMF
ncbi:type II toxin-antitoxin system CcdA family antitoxin [Sediminicoccus rosea]|uniref:Type II toxin-antitoxin system CcdA family antitoxin n=1 Tax=Sediminicoccus rosea TaxID=1225128 RepID=A0ABZ0PGS6_9PROT|nr:type II toxin-antitoxin system CcdA family antitoxin [Sediminicoccus rosea]WPB84944.1 type II toxin-antitoxin system CcdA family antitoxin [Sediminicoccus rosea]